MTTKSVTLSPEQEAIAISIIERCARIEQKMQQKIDPTNSDEVEGKLAELLLELGNNPLLFAQATAIYDTAKGIASEEAMFHTLLLECKSDIQKKWFDGKLARYNAIYVRVENLLEDVRNQIEGMRSILSFEKENIKNKIFEQKINK